MQRALIILISITLSLAACEKPGCLGRAGAEATITVSPAAFRRVLLNDNINLILVQGIQNTLEITGPENLLPEISHNISGDQLILSNQAVCRWARNPDEQITARLTFTNLEQIQYEGSGFIRNEDTIRVRALDIQVGIGAGDIELTVDNGYTGVFNHWENAGIIMHGKTEQCNTYTNARGYADLSDMIARRLVIEYGGLADTYVQATEELSAINYYKGNIYYRGNPTIILNIRHSSGALIHRP